MAIGATLSTEETCTMLGISRSTLYRYEKEGKLKPTRVGRFKRFPESQIASFLGVEYEGVKTADKLQAKSQDIGPGDDKQTICRGLLAALQATRHYADLVALGYERRNKRMEVVNAYFENGEEVMIDVSGDSGVSLIRDVIRGLAYAAADGGTI